MQSFIVAVAQFAPVFMDRAATIEKAREIVRRASREGARLILFPEGFVPTYPFWAWFVPAGQTRALRELYAALLDQSISMGSDHVAPLSDVAAETRTSVAIGINERNVESSGGSLYNSLLLINDRGEVAGLHRKLIPTAAERLIHARGDGRSLETHDLGIASVGGLICWENYMPLARYALFSGGEQIHLAPTWDHGEPWTSTLRHIAKEGRVVVLGACSAVHRDTIPERWTFKKEFLPSGLEWINPGGSSIVDPDGKFLVEPVFEQEEILYAEIDRDALMGPRFQLDVAGHYARPDIFDLRVDRRPQRVVSFEEEERDLDDARREGVPEIG